MVYALTGSPFRSALQQKNGFRNKKPARPAHAVVRAHLSPAHAVKEAGENVAKLASAMSAAALLMVSAFDSALLL